MDRLRPYVTEGPFVRASALPDAVRHLREERGLSRRDAAEAVGASAEEVAGAEHRLTAAFRLRKRLVEALTGYTLDGPYYRLRRRR